MYFSIFRYEQVKEPTVHKPQRNQQHSTPSRNRGNSLRFSSGGNNFQNARNQNSYSAPASTPPLPNYQQPQKPIRQQQPQQQYSATRRPQNPSSSYQLPSAVYQLQSSSEVSYQPPVKSQSSQSKNHPVPHRQNKDPQSIQNLGKSLHNSKSSFGVPLPIAHNNLALSESSYSSEFSVPSHNPAIPHRPNIKNMKPKQAIPHGKAQQKKSSHSISNQPHKKRSQLILSNAQQEYGLKEIVHHQPSAQPHRKLRGDLMVQGANLVKKLKPKMKIMKIIPKKKPHTKKTETIPTPSLHYLPPTK